MKLRKITTYLLAALLALTGFSACEDEYFFNKAKPTLPPGTPVEISLKLTLPDTPESVKTSRASASTEMNTQVYDLYLMIFNDIADDPNYGKLKSKYYFSSIDSKDQRPCEPKYSSSGSAIVQRHANGRGGDIRHVHTTSGKSRIVAVANCNRKGTALILDDLDQIETYEELKNYMVKTANARGESDLNSSLMVMSGYYCDEPGDVAPDDHMSPCEAKGEDHTGSVMIDAAELQGTLWLAPLHSRVKFVIDGNGHEAVRNAAGAVTIPAGEFIMTSWQVYNLPGQTHLFCDGKTSADIKPVNSDAIIGFTSAYQFTGSELKQGETKPNPENCYGFTFFCADNHPPVDPNLQITDYAQRADWDLNGEEFTTQTNPEDKHYKNAPETATYVVIRGRYVGASEVTGENDESPVVRNVTADVTYTIFLGHNSDTDFKDFTVNRNYNYTYIVRIKGVNQISVEVNKAPENPRPDAEGNLTVTETSDITLDAHYCQHVIHYSRQSVRNSIERGQFGIVGAVPPRGVNIRYTYVPGDGNQLEGMEWVEAYRHTEAERDKKYISYTKARGNAPKKATMTLREFLDDLYAFGTAEGDMNETVTYTLYFEEYYYGDESWKEVADSKERTLSLMGTVTYSPDLNSSYATTGMTFRQLPIRTIYNKSKVTKAWGIESIEEPLYADGSIKAPNKAQHVTKPVDSALGLENYWRHIYHGVSGAGQLEFNQYIDEAGFIRTSGTIPSELLAGCLLRNRDLDGDGKLGITECRWYVPSIEQYQQIFIGRSALPDSVQLYNPDLEIPKFTNNRYAYKNYVSSSNMNFWAEEGLSTGQITGDMGLGGHYIRCARALGIDEGMTKHGNDVPWNMHNYDDTTIDPMYTHTLADENSERHVGGIIDLTVFRPDALKMVPELIDIPGVCNTFNDANKPSAIFMYADTTINLHGNSETNFCQDNMRAASNPQEQTLCNQVLGPGWRMPNISELVAMYWAIGRKLLQLPGGGYASNMLSRTHYYYYELLPANTETEPHYTEKPLYYNPKGEPRRAHLLEYNTDKASDVFMLTTPGDGQAWNKENKVIRCVKDYVAK